MMKKYILALLTITGYHTAFNQELLPIFEDTVMTQSEFKISSFNYYSSNTFNNEFIDKFIFGGHISDDLISNNQKRLSKSNTFGGEVEQSIQFYNKDMRIFNRDNFGFLVSFTDNHFASGNLSSDLFNLAMNGNEAYTGDTLGFNFSHFEYQHYQKIGFGFFDKKTKSSITASFVTGSKEINGQLNDAYMLSNPDTVTIAMQGTGSRTDRFAPYLGFQGSGFSIDMNYNLVFENRKGDPQVINLKINNLGVIFWNKFSHRYLVDSTVQYSGFDVHDFIRNNGESPTYNFEDTLGIRTAQGKHATNLPIEFVLQKTPDLRSTKKIQLIAGFKTILTPEYFPYFFVGAFYRPLDKLALTSRVSYGGFGGFKIGLNMNYWNYDRLSLSVGTYDMIGLISKQYGFGRGANLMLNVKL